MFTSYVVAGIGGGTILLINVMSPGVTKQMTSSLDRASLGIAVAGDPVDDRVRADPQDDEGRRLMMPLVFGALAALFLALGLAAIPMLRDAGPVERLGGRIGGVQRDHRAHVGDGQARRGARGAARAAAGAEPAGQPARGARAQARLRGAARAG